jgi:phage shock protein C
MNERLYRSVDDRMMLGVLGGIALRLEVDPSLVRLVFVIAWIATGLVPLFVVYIIAGLIIPEAPAGYEAWVRATRTRWGPGAPDAQGPSWPDATAQAGWPAPPPPARPAWTASSAEAGTAGAAAGAADPASGGTDPAGGAGGSPPGPGQAPVGPPPAWGSAWDTTGRPMPAPPRREGDGRVAAAIGGVVLVGLGAIFLAGQLVPEVDWGLVWPVALIALGALLVIGSIRRA